MPGTYNEPVTLKSYIYIQGAGPEVTTINYPTTSREVISIANRTNVAISGFTIKGGVGGIQIYSSSPMIVGNVITGNTGSGISCSTSSSPTIIRNTITGNNGRGISIYLASSPTVQGNTITGNSEYGILIDEASPDISGNTITGNGYDGIAIRVSSPMIIGNNISGNGQTGISNLVYSSPLIKDNNITENNYEGIYINQNSSPTIIHNKIIGNGGATYTDITVGTYTGYPPSTPNISFNVYDDITGDTGVGQFNVKSDGSLAPAP